MKNMTKRVLAVALSGVLCGTVLLTQGCDNPDKTGGAAPEKSADASGGEKVGVINLGAVADAMGWGQNMTQKSKELKDASEADINKVKGLLQDDIKAQMKAMGLKENDKADSLSDKDKQKLGQLIGRDDQYLQQLTQAANQRMQAYQNQWVQEYRRVLGPIISEVADQKHVSVVINYTEPVLYADPSVDLTKAVIADASGKPMKLNEIPMPGPLVNITANAATNPSATQPAAK